MVVIGMGYASELQPPRIYHRHSAALRPTSKDHILRCMGLSDVAQTIADTKIGHQSNGACSTRSFSQ